MSKAEILEHSAPSAALWSSELRQLVREGLKADFEISRKVRYDWELFIRWISGRQVALIKLNNSVVPKLGSSYALETFCNKPTSLYCCLKGELYNDVGALVFGCLYKEWFTCHADKPRLDFGHFFSNQLCAGPTGPHSIAEIVCMHTALCDQVSSTLQSDRRFAGSQKYKLLPLCRAIIVVMDARVPMAQELIAHEGEADWVYDLDRLAQLQTVLMVLTAVSDGLSAPIHFDDIGPRSKLAVNRSDVPRSSSRDVVRVSVATAVKFISDLLRRENERLNPQENHPPYDKSLGPALESDPRFPVSSADTYADRILNDVDGNGIDKVPKAQEALDLLRSGDISVSKFPFHSRLGI